MNPQQPGHTREYSVRRSLYAAWFDRAFYREVADKWSGFAGAYLLVIVTMMWIPAFFGFSLVSVFFKQSHNYPDLRAQIPQIIIHDGQLKLNKASPYKIQDDKGNAFVVFDTSADADAILHYGALLMLTKTHLVILTTSGPKQISLKLFGDWKLGPVVFDRWVSLGLYWFIVALLPCFVLLSWCYRLGQAVFLGTVMWLINLFLKTRLSVATCIRLAAAALTPAILLSLLEYVLPAFMYRYSWIYLLITTFYCSFALVANRDNATSASGA